MSTCCSLTASSPQVPKQRLNRELWAYMEEVLEGRTLLCQARRCVLQVAVRNSFAQKQRRTKQRTTPCCSAVCSMRSSGDQGNRGRRKPPPAPRLETVLLAASLYRSLLHPLSQRAHVRLESMPLTRGRRGLDRFRFPFRALAVHERHEVSRRGGLDSRVLVAMSGAGDRLEHPHLVDDRRRDDPRLEVPAFVRDG